MWRNLKMWRQYEMLLGILLSAVSLCVSASIIRQHHWHKRQTDTLCDLPTPTGLLTVFVQTLTQCLAHVQPQYGEGGVVTFNVTSGLCMIPDPAAMSDTFGQMYESDMEQLIVEDPVAEPCNNSWAMTFKTQVAGGVVFGDQLSLIDILDKGADVKVQLGENVFLESSYIIHKGYERCAVTPFVISKSSWDTVDPDVFWEMTLVCTNGEVFIARQYIGVSLDLSSGKENKDITWYTRKLPEDPNQENPMYAHQASGLMTRGSKGNLVSAVKRGKSIKVWFDSGLPSTASLQRLEIDTQSDDCNVIGQVVFRIGVMMSLNSFSVPLYWWNAMFSTLGAAKITRWNIGEHVEKGDTVSAYDMAWYVDACWSFAFMHSVDGSHMSGSVESLTAHILVGRRVRVLFDSYSMEAENVVVSSTRLITAQFLSQMDTSSSMMFSDGHWKWVRISTDGSFLTDIYEMGSSTKISNSIMSTTASWFVERRRWNQMVVTSSNGTAMEGSKAALVQGIRRGSRLRCVVVFDTNDTLVFTADNVEIHSDGNVAAQMFRYLQFDGTTSTSFVPYWRIMLVCTTGKLQESRWTVGEHVKRGDVMHAAITYWFVDS